MRVDLGHLIPVNMAKDENCLAKFTMVIILVKLAKERIPGSLLHMYNNKLFSRKTADQHVASKEAHNSSWNCTLEVDNSFLMNQASHW